MTDDEVRAYIDAKIAAIPGARVEVLPAEYIRHDYQRRAVERAMTEVANLSPDEREAIRFLLGQGVYCSARRVSVGIQQSDAGSTQQKWRNVLDGLASSGLLMKGGANKAEFKPRLQEWVASELSPHSASEKEVEDTYQAILGRIAGASA